MVVTKRLLVFGVVSGAPVGATTGLLLWALNPDSEWLLTGLMTAVALIVLNTIWPPKAMRKLFDR